MATVLQSAKIDRSEILVLSTVAIAHLLVLFLLGIAIWSTGSLDKPVQLTPVMITNAVDRPDVAFPNPPPMSRFIPDTAVAPPEFIVDASQVVTGPSYDPYAGAAVAPAEVKATLTLAATNAVFAEWLPLVRTRFAARAAVDGGTLRPAIIEVLAKPAGGFADIRIKSTTGAYEVDNELLAAVMLNQSLVAPGVVQHLTWIALPPIEWGKSPTRTQ